MFDEDLRAVGTERPTVVTALAAYRAGLFPMGLGEGGGPPLGWWAPVLRGVLLPGDLRVSRSLRRSMRTFDYACDTAFAEVVDACADPAREGAWITAEMRELYLALHAAGWAHSVEAYRDGELAGGLFGVSLGGIFIGESMFHRRTDASKAALAALVGMLEGAETPGAEASWMIDVQWSTPHLESLGVSEIPGFDYAVRLHRAQHARTPQVFSRGPLADVNFYGM
ncbi:leucyl/phenylalanyl-tRNA--protein transferase [Brevibacterium album]|uniref:leucyl/phenylalanyl-tRNA--protein transferase n=1 Tax=Brevibacterium album TaxID=417948 RepID=UPI0003FF7EDC|nr:leucyl/phenylalanyl-tRNA--protein transferase [Brevibacterium album]